MSAVAHLRRWLESHSQSDETERAHRRRMQSLLASGPAACHRDHFEPGHFTSSAFVLSPERDALLLILHRKLGLWLQPGGHIEREDPDLVAAARREVLEEVGLDDLELVHDGILDLDVHAIPARPKEPGHAHFDVRFLFRAPSRSLVTSDEVDDARWVPLDEIGDVHGDESVLRAARKIRSLCAPR